MLEISLSKIGDFPTVANIATMMKHQGILSKKTMQIVARFIDKIDSMDCDQLSHFTLMFLSKESQQAFDVEKELPRLEEALCKNLN